MRAPFALLALGLLVPATASADEDWPTANPQRPSFSSNAGPTEVGALELETGVLVDRERGATDDLIDIVTALKVGITPWFGVTFAFSTELAPTSGLDYVGLALKFTLRQPDDGQLGVAINPYMSFPPPVGDDAWGVGAALIVTYPFGDFSIDGNLIFDGKLPAMGDASLTIHPVVTFNYPIVGKLEGYLEARAVIPTDGSEVGVVTGAGFGFALAKNLVFDIGIDVGLTDAVPSFVIQAGVTMALYVVKPRK